MRDIAATTLGSNIDIVLYRAGAKVGGQRFAGFNSGTNPDLPLGVATAVPFDNTNPDVTGGGMPYQAGDIVFANTAAFGVLIALFG